MPIIKSAKKRMRQNLKRRAINYPVRSEMKTVIKKLFLLVKDGNIEEAKKFIGYAYSIIDKACKKNIIHPNNAARKKSQLAKALNELEAGGGKKVEEVKKGSKKKAKKVEVKEEKAEEVVEEKVEEKEE